MFSIAAVLLASQKMLLLVSNLFYPQSKKNVEQVIATISMKKSVVKNAPDEHHVQQLLILFPRGDPQYFKACLEYYQENPVERITEKIMTELGGHYPQLPAAQQEHDNRLNACLRILATELFPDCDISYLRDLVLTFSYAHIEQVTDSLLTAGRWPERLAYGKMLSKEGIRSEKYKRQAQLQLMQDYPQIWKSSIRAVLTENNWDYLSSFDQLKEMGSVGFWNTLRNFFRHWSHSLPEQQAISDYHLQAQLKQLNQRSIDVQIKQDLEMAHRVNEKEYTEENQLMTCGCCYGDYAFEQLAFCSEGMHLFCHGCLTKYMSEGLFGQGTLRGQSRIACISSTDECAAVFQFSMLKRVLSADIWLAYENSLLDGGTLEIQRIQCCACSYFELDESMQPFNSTVVERVIGWIARWTMVVEFMSGVFVMNLGLVMLTLFLMLFIFQWVSFQQWDIKRDLEIAHLRVARSRRGSVFNCKSCKTLSCLQCHHPVRGLHTCWEKETDGLRLYVEKAMADAVKRTCPNCFLSFQKSDGCNKIVCRCGYTMCYVCRKDIGKESYAHFCDHFRVRPGSKCTECTKCDLYKTPPDDEVVQLAATKAKNQYLQAHPEVNHPNITIGPKNTLDKLDELRQSMIIGCLERGLEYII